jgi:hypothetical protein
VAVTSCNSVCVLSSTETEDGHRTYDVLWRVITDSKNDGPQTIRAHSGLPQRMTDSYAFGSETDTAAICVARDPKLKDASEGGSRLNWDVTVKYSTNLGSTRDPETPPNDDPLTEPPIIETYTTKGKRAVLYDGFGRLIASSAHEPYDPVPEVDDTHYNLRIIKNQSDIFPATYPFYRDAVNSDFFFGCPPNTVKVETPGAITKLYRTVDDQPYYRVTWEFAINMDGWDLKLYDYGMYRLVGATFDPARGHMTGGTREVLRDIHGVELTSPALLDGAGGVLPVGDFPVSRPPYHVYRRMPFSFLGLPNSF